MKVGVSNELIRSASDDLKREALLESVQAFKISLGSLSRRDVIKKVGFSSTMLSLIRNSHIGFPTESVQDFTT
jgi:hypothetical protein